MIYNIVNAIYVILGLMNIVVLIGLLDAKKEYIRRIKELENRKVLELDKYEKYKDENGLYTNKKRRG